MHMNNYLGIRDCFRENSSSQRIVKNDTSKQFSVSKFHLEADHFVKNLKTYKNFKNMFKQSQRNNRRAQRVAAETVRSARM